ncbi:PAS domain S-box protein [Methylomonas sp. LL1]|uniref:PAS domain S-box protein n=1 Tax=Methylomonas sp. LL1 TaxID=2785785 RepID=UPI0018C3CF50|nr:PAS domain S-box protein [Methylomonas sp. LL1]QPK64857.1 PAS domain S-box protein [Methylomonas sp. LL1]
MHPRPSMPLSSKIVLSVGILGVVIGTLGIRLSPGLSWIRFFDNLHWTSGTAAAAILAWLSLRRAAPADAKSLFWFALGLSGYAVGQILWDIQTATAYANFPAPSDLFYLWLGPCIAIGLLLEIRNHTVPSERKTIWLDALTLTVAMLTLILALYLPKRGETEVLPLLILIAYPATLFGATSLALTMIPALRQRLRSSLSLFLAGLVTTGLSWMEWNFMALDGTAIDGAWFNISFSVAVLLIGFSLTRWEIEKNTDPDWDRLCEGVLRLFPLLTVVMASLAVVFSHTLNNLPFIVQTAANIGSAVVIVLAMFRQGALLKERDALLLAQAALMASRRELALERGQLKSLVCAIPDLVWLKDPDGIYLSCNPRFEQFFGAGESRIIGKTDYDFVDRELADFFRQHDQKAMEAGGPCSNEEWLTFANGGYRGLFETIKTPMRDESGRLIGVLGVARDITERKRLEEELKLAGEVYQSSSEAIMVTDEGNHIIAVNPAFSAITGYSAGEALGQSPRLLKSGRHDADFYRKLWSSLLNQGRWRGELWNRRKNGEVYPEWISIGVIRNADGSIHRYLSLFTDITERKQAEEELRHYKDHLEETVLQRTEELRLARDAAEAANKAKSVFLANMSHELRTPLNAILGFSSMMRRDLGLSDSQIENLDIINRSGEHLLRLINDVLEMAKIEADRLQLELAPFDLGSMVRDVTEMMQIRAQEKGLRLLLDQTSEFPRYIKSDEARIRQILINLINNAVKFTEQGSVTVRLGVKNNARHHLLIEIQDSGSGIAPEDQDRMFEPFVRLSESAPQPGTGLGLTITRQFVKLMGGCIRLESIPGKGSLFRVELPVELANMDDMLKPELYKLGEVVGLAPGQPRYKILIVEDQRENQLLLSRLMAGLGLEVMLAENGKQGVELFQSWRPDLIWMDRQMPVMDGIEATRRIRRMPNGEAVKIVAVTASAFKEEQREILDAGMDDFVRKPYRFDEIYDCLARQLDITYIYSSQTLSDEPNNVTLTAGMLAILPAELREELRQALINLNSERIAEIIRRIGGIDANLALAMSRLAEYFDYPTILKLLDEAKHN